MLDLKIDSWNDANFTFENVIIKPVVSNLNWLVIQFWHHTFLMSLEIYSVVNTEEPD